jgi:homoserine O-succinyltransferase
MTNERATSQDIRPIEIALLNLMPTKVDTETQLLRLLSNTPLQVNITFIKTATYKSTNTSKDHLDKFYVEFEKVSHRKFDGFIVTGAPVETLKFEEVKYWEELRVIMDWARDNVTSTMFICWATQAALYHHFGIEKVNLKKKLSGVFPHIRAVNNEPLLKGVDDVFYIPHSRFTGLDETQVENCKHLRVLAQSDKAKSSIIKTRDNKMFFFTGHGEYDTDTLDKEYRRDLAKGLSIKPVNYYKNDKPTATWRAAANVIFNNWLNYYVYQVTPYDLGSPAGLNGD